MLLPHDHYVLTKHHPALICPQPTGPVSSFLVISDPAAAKHVLRSTDNNNRNIYDKGLVAEVSQFLFGDGFAVAGGEHWRARRRAVGPSLHRCVSG